jgi:hypothetical protein
MIDRMELSSTELAEKIDVALPSQVAAWQGSSPLAWADESRAASDPAYALGDRRLGYKYLYEHTPAVERRLLQAGVRLAGILDRALGARREEAGDWLPERELAPVSR